jgi:hypothetical protein
MHKAPIALPTARLNYPAALAMSFARRSCECWLQFILLIKEKVILVRRLRNQRRPLGIIPLSTKSILCHGRRNLKLRFSLLEIRGTRTQSLVMGLDAAEFAVEVNCNTDCYADREYDDDGADPGCLMVGE